MTRRASAASAAEAVSVDSLWSHSLVLQCLGKPDFPRRAAPRSSPEMPAPGWSDRPRLSQTAAVMQCYHIFTATRDELGRRLPGLLQNRAATATDGQTQSRLIHRRPRLAAEQHQHPISENRIRSKP